jgi:hypothetical protein
VQKGTKTNFGLVLHIPENKLCFCELWLKCLLKRAFTKFSACFDMSRHRPLLQFKDARVAADNLTGIHSAVHTQGLLGVPAGENPDD